MNYGEARRGKRGSGVRQRALSVCRLPGEALSAHVTSEQGPEVSCILKIAERGKWIQAYFISLCFALLLSVRLRFSTSWRRDPPPTEGWPRAPLGNSLRCRGLEETRQSLRGLPVFIAPLQGWRFSTLYGGRKMKKINRFFFLVLKTFWKKQPPEVSWKNSLEPLTRGAHSSEWGGS